MEIKRKFKRTVSGLINHSAETIGPLTLKLGFLGDKGVGKTSLLQRISTNTFSFPPSTGVSPPSILLNEKTVTIELVSCSLTPEQPWKKNFKIFEGVSGFIIAYSRKNPHSFDSIGMYKQFIDDLNFELKLFPKPPILLLALQSEHLQAGCISQELADSVSFRWDCLQAAISSKSDDKSQVTEVFGKFKLYIDLLLSKSILKSTSKKITFPPLHIVTESSFGVATQSDTALQNRHVVLGHFVILIFLKEDKKKLEHVLILEDITMMPTVDTTHCSNAQDILCFQLNEKENGHFLFQAETPEKQMKWMKSISKMKVSSIQFQAQLKKLKPKKNQNLSTLIQSEPSNRLCLDCGADDPHWVLLNSCALVCTQCATIHQSLGNFSLVDVLYVQDHLPTDFCRTQIINERVNSILEKNSLKTTKPHPKSSRAEKKIFIELKHVQRQISDSSPFDSISMSLNLTLQNDTLREYFWKFLEKCENLGVYLQFWTEVTALQQRHPSSDELGKIFQYYCGNEAIEPLGFSSTLVGPLLEKVAKKEVLVVSDFTPLVRKISSKLQSDLWTCFLDSDFGRKAKDYLMKLNGSLTLCTGAKERFSDTVLKCLLLGVDPNCRHPLPTEGFQTPLHYAVKSGNETTIRLLLLNNADPNLRNSQGLTPLQCAGALSPKALSLLMGETTYSYFSLHPIFLISSTSKPKIMPKSQKVEADTPQESFDEYEKRAKELSDNKPTLEYKITEDHKKRAKELFEKCSQQGSFLMNNFVEYFQDAGLSTNQIKHLWRISNIHLQEECLSEEDLQIAVCIVVTIKDNNVGMTRLPRFTPTSLLPKDITFANGDSYRGSWNYFAQFHGSGCCLESAAGHYQGSFHNGKFSGRGVLKLQNGDQYEGEFREGLYHGQGAVTSERGFIYEGDFLHGKKHGNGKLVDQETGDEYIGEFQYDQLWGRGTLKRSDQELFEGIYAKNKPQKGTYYFANGSVYRGKFKSGLPHGTGTLIDKEGQYEGEFKKGKRHRKGKMIYTNGDIYEGNFFKNRRHGQGTITYHTQEVFSGSFAKDKAKGEFTWRTTNGSEIIGSTDSQKATYTSRKGKKKTVDIEIDLDTCKLAVKN